MYREDILSSAYEFQTIGLMSLGLERGIVWTGGVA
jgi:hypothetical protein